MAQLKFEKHCVFAFILRLLLIAYGNFHDKYFNVSYTDVDYKVFTDASRLLINGESPYERHTYRYSPLLAILLAPNILIHRDIGKLIFSIIDIIVGLLIKKILKQRKCIDKLSDICALTWLYNPLTIVISTRGNADSLAVLFVLLTIYYLLNDSPLLSGILHGLSIHFRLYPIAFSLVMYLAIRNRNDKWFLLPNKKQIKLVAGCILSITILTSFFYYIYGYKFIYESLIYHLIRNDSRHNFSIYFYMLYLTTGKKLIIAIRILRVLPQIILLIGLSFKYSNKHDLSFSMLTQAMVMVTYNSVITSQYFFWYLSLLPISLPFIKMNNYKIFILTLIWIIGQTIWLYFAYLLEFFGINTFTSIWMSSLLFFFINIKILIDVIKHYDGSVEKIKS
ncbi:GPI mannosyltransferase 1, partial [Aphidius gifuensis]|uniref:GPI mannosyltransferase 1 n=1 Tax=Aphidius gifuensis TaxID=684658 RepID=UPI001CDD21CB